MLSISKNLGPYVRTGIAALVLLASCRLAYAGDIALAWDESPDPVAGYKVYVGNASGTYGPPINVGNQTTYTVTGLAPGTYYFAVTAYDSIGNESSYSNEVFKTIQDAADTTPSAITFEASLSSGGGLSRISSGQGSLAVYYGQVTSSGSLPAALANLSFTQNGVLVTEVGVPAVSLMTSARLFVDSSPGTDSGVALVNTNNFPIGINLDLRDESGAIVSSTSMTLEAKTHMARFVSELIPNLPNPFLGTLTLSSGSAFAAVNLRSATNGHGETIFNALPLSDLNAPPSAATRLIFPQVLKGSGASTQILLLNPSPTTAGSGMIYFIDDLGNPLPMDFGSGLPESSLFYTMPPNGMVKFSTSAAGGLRAGCSVVVPTSGPLPVGSAIISIAGDQGLASQAGVMNAPETTLARMFVEGAATPLKRNTGIALVNRNDAPASVSLTLVDEDGNTQTKEMAVSPNGRLVQFVSELFPNLPSQFQGACTLSSNVPIAATPLRLTVNQRGDDIYSTLPVADLNHPAVGPLFIPQIVDGGGYQTRLIVLNTSDNAKTIQIDFFNDQGTNVGLLWQ